MKKISITLIIGSALCSLAVEMNRPPRPDPYKRHTYLRNRVELKPAIETPLRHVFVCAGPDGAYYLTGTRPSERTEDSGQKSAKNQAPGTMHQAQKLDFHNNDGVFLWRSADLKNWEPLGQVWSIEKQGNVWQKEQRLNPDDPAGPLVNGMTAPEIHYIKGQWYIPYSMNMNGTGLLKSQSGKPEGPYEDLGMITAGEGSPSLFEDFDGTVYWVWGPGRICKMNEALNGLSGRPAQLTLGLDQAHRSGASPLGARAHLPESAFLFKTEGKIKNQTVRRYHMTFESGSNRMGTYVKDAFVASSDELWGVYEDFDVFVKHGAQTCAFTDGKNWFCTFYGDDPAAVYRDRATILPMKFDKQRLRPSRDRWFTDFTTAGPWVTITPLIDSAQVNDQQILNAPDGYYYFTGSVWDNFHHGGAVVWKSKTLEGKALQPENWEEFRVCPFTDIPGIRRAAERVPGLLDFTVRRNPHISGVAWGTEIHYVKGNYWILYQILSNNKIVQEELKKDGGGMNPLFRSATGKAEGPYEFVANLPISAASLYEDDDGSVYLLGGKTKFLKMKEDMTGVDTEFMERIQAEKGYRKGLQNIEGLQMDYDIGFSMHKIGGKYVIFTCNCVGGYDQQYWVSKDIWGPYSRPRVMMPHGGHSFVMKDKQGTWHSLQWAKTTAMAPCLHELHVEDTGEDIIMMPKWEWERKMKDE